MAARALPISRTRSFAAGACAAAVLIGDLGLLK